MEKKEKAIDLLDFNVNKLMFDMEDALSVYDINVQGKEEVIKNIFNNTVEVSLELVDSDQESSRSITVKRNGKGQYRSIKNIRFSLVDFIDAAMGLFDGSKYRYVSIAAFIWKVFKQINVSLDREQVYVSIILYNATKKCIVTDENIIELINTGTMEDGRREMQEDEIWEILEELYEYGIIDIDEGKYAVMEKIVIE